MRAFMEWDETPALKRAVMVQFLGIIAKTRRAREAKSIECVRGSSSRSLMPEHSSCHPGGVRLIALWRDVSSNLPSRSGILNHSASKLLERSDISKHEPLLRKPRSGLFGKRIYRWAIS